MRAKAIKRKQSVFAHLPLPAMPLKVPEPPEAQLVICVSGVRRGKGKLSRHVGLCDSYLQQIFAGQSDHRGKQPLACAHTLNYCNIVTIGGAGRIATVLSTPGDHFLLPPTANPEPFFIHVEDVFWMYAILFAHFH